MWSIPTTLSLYFGAMVLSAMVCWVIIRSGARIGMDQPDEHRKRHAAPVSRLGGLGLFAALTGGFVVMLLRLPHFWDEWWPLIIANSLIFGVGLLDDLKPLGAKAKLLGQVAAAVLLYSLGVSIDILSNPFGDGSIELGAWSLPVTVLWLIAVPNIINLIDGMDGLAAGFGLFLCITLAAIGHFGVRPDVVIVAIVMIGALSGFLAFNLPPARIFLGDGGAYLIGFFVASVSLMTSNKASIMASLLVVCMALGIPILDTAFAIIRRGIRGMPIFRADAEHIHHRLITLGFSKRQALITLYSACLVLSLVGISVFLMRGYALPIIGSVAALLVLVSARYLGYIRSWKRLRAQVSAALARRRQRMYFRTYCQLLEMEIDRCQCQEEYHSVLESALQRLQLSGVPGSNTCPLTLRHGNGQKVTLHRPALPESDEEWQYRAELLETAISRALVRWPSLIHFFNSHTARTP
jgi:UDP-GlcNAc:undecaprenyl-phosphate GlcNAc-1-phosphate transferase